MLELKITHNTPNNSAEKSTQQDPFVFDCILAYPVPITNNLAYMLKKNIDK